jgi:phosphomannomutase
MSSEWITNAASRYIAETAKTHPSIAAFVETLKALPLVVDGGGGVALRSDGELIGFLWHEPQSIKIESDPHLRFLAVAEGSRNFAELACLAPVRAADDRDCPVCDGTGRLRELEQADVDTNNIRCYCGGIGWLPSNVRDPPWL